MKKSLKYLNKRPKAKPHSKVKLGKSVVSSCGVISYNDVTRIHPVMLKSLGHCLFKISFLLKNQYEQSLSKLRIAPFHAVAIMVLAEDKELLNNQNTLGNELGIDKASMVKIVDHLEKHKLVERVSDPKDRRNKLLKITAKGLKIREEVRIIQKQNESEYLKNLETHEIEALRILIPKLLSSLISNF